MTSGAYSRCQRGRRIIEESMKKKNEWGGGKRCREGDGMGDRCETEGGGVRRRGRVQCTLTDSQE